ncbi:hypothetical protein BD410DRAFT_793277 [Rickenella mellea]|uniref:Uncharacterized protein n=1 Tax=Rickenella mellea TaxID=50990 RepID=A0A4Y7PV37_9AGAM|nr:hypothetical protein BD410DRAFT_793277 [Rickenella mellea]
MRRTEDKDDGFERRRRDRAVPHISCSRTGHQYFCISLSPEDPDGDFVNSLSHE